METTIQAQEQVPTNQNGVQEQVPANSELSTEMQKYVVSSPANMEANAQQAQPQAQVTIQPQVQNEASVAELQRIANQRQIEIYKLQQEVERIRQSQVQTQNQQQNINQNPYDPQTQWDKWMEWKIDSGINTASERASEKTLQNIMSYASQQAQIIAEQQWQAQHPNINIMDVKAFANARGIRDINDAYVLMSLPQNITAFSQQASLQQLNTITQQNTTPTTLRGTQSTPAEIKLSYEQMAREFQNTNGAIYDRWTPQMKQLFDQETYRRSDKSSNR